ncbi:MAG TPA: CpsB/CapC family capsule biosynthesis tyrosine phosphatase [Burkholderiales bacterium]|nr:CpsB/CapC family capsule biosynthesis tyrosine phosphatase [Burkholderiales bacterium]
MIDLHCHYLPGIDDGAQTLEESLDLARAAVSAGITTAVMTPHVHPGRYENNASSIAKLAAAFQRVLAHKQIPLAVRAGGEVRISADIIQMVEDQEIPFLGVSNGYRIMLLEFPHSHLLLGADKLVKWLLARRIRPLIAHPERNKEVMRSVDKIAPFVDMGCLLQLTGGSIIGHFGKPAQDCAQVLLERGWAHVVATDAHNLKHRPPNLDLAYAALVEMGGEALAQRLTRETPSKLIGDEAVPAAPGGSQGRVIEHS